MTALIDDTIARARADKATRITGAVVRSGLSPTDAARLTASARREIEAAAGVRVGSPETWGMVMAALTGSARTPCPWCGRGDPMGANIPVQPFGHAGPCSR